MYGIRWFIGLAVVVSLAGCGGSTHGIAPSGHTTTFVPAPPPPHQEVNLACPQGDILDSRASAKLIIASYFDALNRGDWTRGYSYFFPPDATPSTTQPPPGVPAFAQWRAGYSHTACTILTFAGTDQTVTNASPGYAGIGTGIVVSATLTAIDDNGQITIFAGAYAVRYDPLRGVPASGAIALNFSNLQPI
jgi:hypothetical protein